MSVHGPFMLLLASSGAAAAIVVGPLLARRDILRCRPKSVAIGAKQTSLSRITPPRLWVHGLGHCGRKQASTLIPMKYRW